MVRFLVLFRSDPKLPRFSELTHLSLTNYTLQENIEDLLKGSNYTRKHKAKKKSIVAWHFKNTYQGVSGLNNQLLQDVKPYHSSELSSAGLYIQKTGVLLAKVPGLKTWQPM